MIMYCSIDYWYCLQLSLRSRQQAGVYIFQKVLIYSLPILPHHYISSSSLFNFFPNFNFGWIVSLPKKQGICKNIYPCQQDMKKMALISFLLIIKICFMEEIYISKKKKRILWCFIADLELSLLKQITRTS